MNRLPSSGQRGLALIESTIAAAISASFLGSLFVVNSSAMDTIQLAREAACASQVLQQRIESMRIANWHQVTDASWLATNLLNADAGRESVEQHERNFDGQPYGSITVGNTKLTRSSGTHIVSNNSALLGENAIKII
jgi:type II secretory pathway pseudopilin PulG